MDALLNEAVAMAGVMLPVIAIVVQLVKQADVPTKWLPHISIVLGIAVGLVFGYATGGDLFMYGLAGFLSGAGASGVYDAIQAPRKESK